jgi:hypothetical protein
MRLAETNAVALSRYRPVAKRGAVEMPEYPRPWEKPAPSRSERTQSRAEKREALLARAEAEMEQGIFVSKSQMEVDRLFAEKEFSVERVDCLTVRRAHALASRKVRLLRNLLEVMPVPARLLDRVWKDVEPFADLMAQLVEIGESHLVDLIHRECSNPHHFLEWTERELMQTGKLCMRPSVSGFQEPQSYPQWRTCLMVPERVDVPLGRVCYFQEEAFVFLERSKRTYQIRNNVVSRYGWHMDPSENRVGVYLLGRLAEREELSQSLLDLTIFDLEDAIGAGDGRPRFNLRPES